MPIRPISAHTHVLVLRASPESTVGLLFHAAPSHTKMVELAQIQWISVLTLVCAARVFSEQIAKTQLRAARIRSKIEVRVAIRPISALTNVLVLQASPESTVGLLFHAAPGYVKMVELAKIQR